jgi:hypothetical protein
MTGIYLVCWWLRKLIKEYTKGVNRDRKSKKDRQYNDQKIKGKKRFTTHQNTTHQANDWANTKPTKFGDGGVVKLICPGRVSSFHLLQGVLDITLCHHILLLINRFLLLIFFLYNNSKITVHRIISGICHFYELSVIKWNSVICAFLTV